MTLDKLEVMRKLNEFDVPCGPILDMREIAEERALRACAPSSKWIILAWQVSYRRKSDQIIRFADRGEAIAGVGRAHGRNLEIHRRLERFRDCRGAQRGRGLNPATLRRQN